MKSEEIEQEANEWSDNFDSNIPEFGRIKRDVALLSFREGAKMVNYKQPYTAEELQSFWRWTNSNGWSYGELMELWYNDDEDDVIGLTIDELIKIWEEQK